MTEQTKTFHDMGVDGDIADALAAKGITHPFPIQALTLPMALKGADIIGQARTGTGKTLGFGLPLLQRIDTSVKRTQALVIVPTRELCIQVANDLEVGSHRGVTSIAVYGGVPIDPQTDALVAGVHVVVGTPGRLLDHLNRGNLDLSEVTELVLDEADEMLDMGFLPDVERLIEATPAEGRHTMLFSATMPSTIVSLARRYMSHPTFMRADDEETTTVSTVEQHFFLVHRMDKPRILARILQSSERGGVYVFTRTKHMADRLVEELEGLGVASIPIHGDLRQAAREKNLDKFRDGTANVLVATEVAARGLDVENVTHVVNYDCPDDEKMYLHRIGRTARAGAKGVAITFAEHNEVERLKMIRKAVGSDHDVEEVFSTSDRLQELFDLPDETPWAHLSKKIKPGDPPRRSDRQASSERKARDDDRGGRGGRGRSGSDDRGGRGGRDRSDDRGGRSSSRSAPRSERTEAPPADGKTTDEKATSTRTRTRSRARGDDAGTDSARTSTRERTSSRTDDRSEDAPKPSSSSGRTRARAPKADSGETPDGGRERADDGSKGRSGGGSRERSGSGSRERSGSGSGSRSGSGSGSRSGSGSGSRRSSSGRGGDAGRQREERGPGEEPTRRGQDARGDGTPQFARRVKVEHLP